tara:strand:- start:129 stop:1283 length:1155 start_codon:yes stop_codon:yes gene_type:complete
MAEKKEQPIVDDTVEKLKVKKPKKKVFKQQDSGPVKVDLKELKEKAEEITKVDLKKPVEDIKAQEKPVEEKTTETKQAPVVEEVTNEKKVEPKPAPVKQEVKQPEKPVLPENVEKLVSFMKETGGNINDYVKLNKDYSDMDNHTLLKEYYKTTKPHLKTDEIDFLMEDQFSYNEDSDEEKEIKRKKLALKEQVASAKSHLDGLKSKYYEDIKMGSKLPDEAKKAVDFFNRYNKESEELKQAEEQAHSAFKQKTDTVFNDEFKGFEYSVGDKRFRFNVNNAGEIKEKQSDIGNFIGKFLNDNNQIEDAKGYHKALYTAMNSDAIAKHFYEQGKADALKDSVAKSKNIDMNPRESHSDTIVNSGLKVRALGNNSNDFKFKIRKKNK